MNSESTVLRHNPHIDPTMAIWGWEIPVYLFLGGAVAGLLVLAGVFVLVLALLIFPNADRSGSGDHVVKVLLEPGHRVSATEVASWYAEGRRDFEVIDLRDAASFDAGSLPQAIHCGGCHSDHTEGRAEVDNGTTTMPNLQARRLVFITAEKEAEIPLFLTGTVSRLLVLEGGYAAFRAIALTAATGIAENEGAGRRMAKQTALYGYLTGLDAPPAPVEIQKKVQLIRHKPKSGANEGC